EIVALVDAENIVLPSERPSSPPWDEPKGGGTVNYIIAVYAPTSQLTPQQPGLPTPFTRALLEELALGGSSGEARMVALESLVEDVRTRLQSFVGKSAGDDLSITTRGIFPPFVVRLSPLSWQTAGQSQELTDKERAAFESALLEAFPSRYALEQLLRIRLD